MFPFHALVGLFCLLAGCGRRLLLNAFTASRSSSLLLHVDLHLAQSCLFGAVFWLCMSPVPTPNVQCLCQDLLTPSLSTPPVTYANKTRPSRAASQTDGVNTNTLLLSAIHCSFKHSPDHASSTPRYQRQSSTGRLQVHPTLQDPKSTQSAARPPQSVLCKYNRLSPLHRHVSIFEDNCYAKGLKDPTQIYANTRYPFERQLEQQKQQCAIPEVAELEWGAEKSGHSLVSQSCMHAASLLS